MTVRRNTIQKSLVLNAISQLDCHATAEEIYAHIASIHPTIGKGTVYRNLGLLVEDGKILKIEIPNGPDHYDHRTHSHHHVICNHCGKVFDIDVDYPSDIMSHVTNDYGFKMKGYSILFNGICPECQK